MTQKKLEALLVEWQAILRLNDWDVKASMVDAIRMPRARGDCSYVLETKTAEIRVRKPINDGPWPADPEEAFVHELLHLHFAPFEAADDGSPQSVSQEQAINLIALALVTLKRRKPRGS